MSLNQITRWDHYNCDNYMIYLNPFPFRKYNFYRIKCEDYPKFKVKNNSFPDKIKSNSNRLFKKITLLKYHS